MDPSDGYASDRAANGSAIFRTAAIFFYVGREGLSVARNLGTLKAPMPKRINQLLKQL
ncbi:phage holin family protein [Cohnella thailandensis]|uniref:phage holin family protein n=1 Tax=Cohnella thailandensis TaxID=557557 RepID=UPI003CC98E4F